MSSESPYKIGLEPKILSRAKLILGFLLLSLTILAIAGVHQGVNSGDFNKVFVKPFREFAADFEKATQPSPTPTPKPSTTPSPTPAPIKKSAPAAVKTKPAYSNCIRKNIREGEFASNKCYSPADYEDLNYYLQSYNNAVFNLQIANDSMKITCNCRVQQECDFFKQSCEDDKNKKTQAEADINNYRGIIQGIIAKGQ